MTDTRRHVPRAESSRGLTEIIGAWLAKSIQWLLLAGVLGGMMNFAGNIGGIVVPIIVGVIVQATGSYFLALMFFTACGVLYTCSSLIIDYSRKLPV